MLRTFTKIALAFAVPISLAVAGEWEQSLSVAASAEHDSNPAMSVSAEGSVWRGRLAPTYSLVGNFGRDDYLATLGLQAEQSTDERLSKRRQDKSGSFSWGHAFDTGGLRFSARADEASTRGTELEDSGLVSRESTRRGYSVGLNGQDSLSEKTSLTVGVSQDGAHYDDAALRNYANQTAEIGLSYALAARVGTTSRLAVIEFDPDGAGVPSTTYSLSLGVSAPAEVGFGWSAQYGFRHTVAETKNDGSDGLLSLQWKAATDVFSLVVSRQFSPSSIGSMSVVDSAKGAWQSHWGPKSRSSFDLSLTKRHGALETETVQATVALLYDISSASNIRIYVQEKRLGRANSAVSATIVGASLAYNWRP